MTVSGVEADLEALAAEQMVLTADLSEYRRAGTYEIPVSVTVPEHIQVPEGLEITLTLVKAEE